MIKTFSHWILYFLSVTFLKGQYAGANPLPNTETIGVTGYLAYGELAREYLLVLSNATWFDTVDGCRSLQGYILTSGSAGLLFTYLRKQIFSHYQHLIGEPIWTGFHKPNLDGLWYGGTNCMSSKRFGTFANDISTERQCLLLNTTTNQWDVYYTWYAASCHERHPYFCLRYTGTESMSEYVGMAQLTTDKFTYTVTETTTTKEDCKASCVASERYHCQFNASAASCVIFMRSLDYLPFEFNLTYVGDDIISYVKNIEHKVVLVNVSDPTAAYTYRDLPCYKDPAQQTTTAQIPQSTNEDISSPSYSNPDQIEQIVNKLKEENTVDVKTLSSYQNKFKSVDDNRPSSKAIGTVGLICIVIAIGLVLVSDVPKLINDCRSIDEKQPKDIKRNKETFFFKTTNVSSKFNMHQRRYSF